MAKKSERRAKQQLHLDGYHRKVAASQLANQTKPEEEVQEDEPTGNEDDTVDTPIPEETPETPEETPATDPVSPVRNAFDLENLMSLRTNPYAGIVLVASLIIGGFIGCNNPNIDPAVQEIGSTANEDNTTLNLKTASGNYQFQLANDSFKGNILTAEEYELVREREAVVSAQARADAMQNMSQLLRAQSDIASSKAAEAAAKSNVETSRHIMEKRQQAATSGTVTQTSN